MYVCVCVFLLGVKFCYCYHSFTVNVSFWYCVCVVLILYIFHILFLSCAGTTFQAYVDANSKSFPCDVVVDTGYYGSHGKSSLYEEQLTLHFEMKLRTVRGKVDRGATYHIPLSSSLQFSLLHNPSDNIQQAMLGHYFETVGHILAQPSRNRPLVRYMHLYMYQCVYVQMVCISCDHVCIFLYGCVSMCVGVSH